MTSVEDKVPCAGCGKPVSPDQAAKRSGLCLLCSIKLEEKVPCTGCGKPVSVRQASKRNGLCLRCSANRNPFFVLYNSLIDRVCNSPDGFQSLSDDEKIYYALTLLQNEVNNGGFHQFFFNSSGSYYELIEHGLIRFEEPKILSLLHQAKQILFPEITVPLDKTKRRERMPLEDANDNLMAKLNELDQQFYVHPDTLTAKLQAFARERELVPAEPESNSVQG